MKTVRLISIFVLFFFGILLSLAIAADSATIVAEGNHYYYAQQYDRAIQRYEEALRLQPNSSSINFNIGSAAFKQGDFKKAAQAFGRALATADRMLEQKANFNLGNTKYQLALRQETGEAQGKVQLLEESLAHYKRVIELNPNNKKAKANYETVAQLLKKEKEKEQKQPGLGKQKKESQGQSEEQQSQGKEQQNQQGKEQQAQDQGHGKKESSPQGTQQEKEQQPGKQEENKQESPEEMSQQEAQMLLDGYNREENIWGKIDDTRKGRIEKVLKDW